MKRTLPALIIGAMAALPFSVRAQGYAYCVNFQVVVDSRNLQEMRAAAVAALPPTAHPNAKALTEGWIRCIYQFETLDAARTFANTPEVLNGMLCWTLTMRPDDGSCAKAPK